MPVSLTDFEHVRDARLRGLLQWWLEARDGAAVPPVTAVDPMAFRDVLDAVWLCDVEDEPRDFRYRLAGEHVRSAHDQNMTGRRLSELTPPAAWPRIREYFSYVVDLPAVVHMIGRIYSEADRPASGERLILPFADPDTGRSARILGATLHSWDRRGVPNPDTEVPDRQERTVSPVCGAPAWCEWRL
ncbi:MAG: PAS domain-containing protein [Alphaproteobacteria bacterium]|nr:PAS domain-containing protein [Alphaproteobacteria bacterium]